MKLEVYFSAVLLTLTLVQVNCETEFEKNVRFESCLEEVGIKGKPLSKKKFEDIYPCLLACISQKMGIMIKDKIAVDKYIEHYSSIYSPSAVTELEKNKLTECAAEANKLSNKCEVREAMRKCEFENRNILYPPIHD